MSGHACSRWCALSLAVLSVLTGCRREVDFSVYENLVKEEPTISLPYETPGADAVVEDVKSSDSVPAVYASPGPTPTREPPSSTALVHTVAAGDTLLRIAARYGTSAEMLMRLNGISDADQIKIGQQLRIAVDANVVGPSERLLPDSEVVYGPAYRDYGLTAALSAFPGFIQGYSEEVSGITLSSSEIVQLVATQYSIGPRVLLALLELRGGWLNNPAPTELERTYPLGYFEKAYNHGLYYQLCMAADALNTGFYGWREDTLWLVQTGDGSYVQFSPELNAGTAGVQYALAASAVSYETWLADLTHFAEVYTGLFGDPEALAIEPLVPPTMRLPILELPWPVGETWYYTGGPHPGWGTLGAFSAVDFVTSERNIGCAQSALWVTAAADGPVEYSNEGMVLQDLDGDGSLTTGWVLLYMHIASDRRVSAGAALTTGDAVGHPSCEGGYSNASHVHFARRYNGVWISADDDAWPMVLSGWRPRAGGAAYDGSLVKGDQERVACECWEAINAVQH